MRIIILRYGFGLSLDPRGFCIFVRVGGIIYDTSIMHGHSRTSDLFMLGMVTIQAKVDDL
jgi:hypothetical protein